MADLSQQVTAAEAATILGITPATIYMWKRRNLVEPVSYRYGRGRGGTVPEYDLTELREVAERMASTRHRQS
ncbi:hypothetical protein [Nocardioides marmoraquaticus]